MLPVETRPLIDRFVFRLQQISGIFTLVPDGWIHILLWIQLQTEFNLTVIYLDRRMPTNALTAQARALIYIECVIACVRTR